MLSRQLLGMSIKDDGDGDEGTLHLVTIKNSSDAKQGPGGQHSEVPFLTSSKLRP